MKDLEQARKDPKFIASAVLIALIVIAGIVLAGIYAFGGGDDAKGAAPEPTSSASKRSPSSSSCGLPDGDQAIPTVAPKAQWALSGKTAAPTSKIFGPGENSGGIHACFAHNPTGALFSAANYLADTSNPSSDSKALVAARVYSDENTDSAAGSGDGGSTARPTYQISAYRFQDFTASRGTVALVVRATEGPNAGQNYSISFTLGWQRGDWRIIVPPGGQPPTSALASLNGYTPWSGA